MYKQWLDSPVPVSLRKSFLDRLTGESKCIKMVRLTGDSPVSLASLYPTMFKSTPMVRLTGESSKSLSYYVLLRLTGESDEKVKIRLTGESPVILANFRSLETSMTHR